MTIEVRLNGQGLQPLLAAPPRISDQLNAICRTLEITIQQAKGLENKIGQPIELWYGGKCWYYGTIKKRGYKSDGSIVYTAYDPLYAMKKSPDDWYFKNMAGNQIFTKLAEASGVSVAGLANTGVIFPWLYYQNAEADKVGIDVLARTYTENGRKFNFRYDPEKRGLLLFERTQPSHIWAFQVGVNLESAEYTESIEETVTVVKLINRETGKVVIKSDACKMQEYGHAVHFEEVDKEEATKMDKKAADLLKQLCKVNTSMKIEGVNPNQIIPQLYTGDVIYVEERYTGLMGAYYIRNIEHNFVNDNLVELSIDIQIAPEIPAIQYEDAAKAPTSSGGSSTEGGSQVYSDEIKKLMEKYGV